ncbi:hypothetical protein ACFWP5_38415 [Streptomyces sp. NPDC058469]|uniref:hypothetical protein n=1 Tax=Streptomyces sp. NPDC058469 TaxID=3346514 RepID=UPI0036491615
MTEPNGSTLQKSDPGHGHHWAHRRRRHGQSHVRYQHARHLRRDVPYKATRAGPGLLTSYVLSPKDSGTVTFDTLPLTVNR